MYKSVIVAAVAGTAAAFAPSAPLAGHATTRAVGVYPFPPIPPSPPLSVPSSLGWQCIREDVLVMAGMKVMLRLLAY